MKRYFTGKPCKYGHISERNVSQKSCILCKKLYNVKRKKDNPERERERQHRWRTENPDKARERSRRHYQKNREKEIARTNRWRRANLDKDRANSHRHRARKINASGTHTTKDIKWLLEKQKYKCVYCKKSVRNKYHVDHIIAISKGGSNSRENLQILCPFCNMSKHDKDPIEYAQSIGLLL